MGEHEQNEIAYHVRKGCFFDFSYTKRISPLNMGHRHFHDGYELFYMVSGERLYDIKDKTYHIRSGDLVLVNAHDLHRTTDAGSKPYERFLMYLKREMLDFFVPGMETTDILSAFHQGSRVLRLGEKERETMDSLMFRIMEEDKGHADGSEICVHALFACLLVQLQRFAGQEHLLLRESPSRVHEKMSRIALFINENHCQPLSLETLSGYFFLNASYLSRVFKKTMGLSFIDYLNHVRILEAQKLLNETGMNITMVSEKVGFESSSHFGRVFKAISGISPTQYRKLRVTG